MEGAEKKSGTTKVRESFRRFLGGKRGLGWCTSSMRKASGTRKRKRERNKLKKPDRTLKTATGKKRSGIVFFPS